MQSRPGLVLSAFGVSSLGDGIRTAALPLLAVTVTSDPVLVSGLVVAGRLPWLLVALFSGAVADRIDRRRLMIIADVCRATVLLGVVAFLLAGDPSIWVLYVLAAALGIGETLFETATQGLLPQVVPPERLASANGNMASLNFALGSFAGPAVGSWLFSLSRVVPLAADALTFLASAVILLVHRVVCGPVAPNEEAPADRPSLFRSVGEGLAWVRDQPLIRAFILVGVLANFTQSAIQSVLVLLATGEMDVPKAAFGLLLTASGVGGFLGAMLSARVGERLGIARVLLPAVASGVPLFAIMAVTSNVVVLGICLALNAFMGVMVSIQMAVLRQRIVPNHLLSRVSSVGQFFAFGIALPLGALAGGLLAGALGTRAVYLGAALVVLALTLGTAARLRPAQLRRAVAEI